MPHLLNRIKTYFINKFQEIRNFSFKEVLQILWDKFKTRYFPVSERNFYKKTELETLIKNGNFELIKSERISKLPEYFIVAKK